MDGVEANMGPLTTKDYNARSITEMLKKRVIKRLCTSLKLQWGKTNFPS